LVPGVPEKPSVLKVIAGVEGVLGVLGIVNRDVSLDSMPKGASKVVLGVVASGRVKVLDGMFA